MKMSSNSNPITVPFLDLHAGTMAQKDELMAAAERVLTSARYIGGPEVAAFETAFAAHVGAPIGIGVGNGLDAIILALQAVGVQAGDEVIVPSHTYIATWLAVTWLGAKPVPIEPDMATMNINPHLVAAAITPRTKAILPVHLYGNAVDMDPILAAAKQHNIPVIADAAQAHGTLYKGQPIGAVSTCTWSLYPGKNLGAYGDAGAVTLADADVAARIRRLGNYGSEKKYVHTEPNSGNSRLDPLQAAFLSVRLKTLEANNTRRRQIADRYLTELAGLPLTLPVVTPDSTPVWHLFVVRDSNRDKLQAHLLENGVETLIHYPTAIHHQQAYAALAPTLPPMPLAEQIASQVISLPIGPHMPDFQVAQVIAAVKSYYAK